MSGKGNGRGRSCYARPPGFPTTGRQAEFSATAVRTVVMSLVTRKYERWSVEGFTLVAAVIKLW